MTAKAYCAGRDFTTGSLHFWSSKLRKGALPDRGGEVRLARVVRVSATPRAASCSLIVEVADARVHVPSDVDTELLARVVAVLRGGKAC